MKLARLGNRDAERPVVLDDGRAYDLTPVTDDIDGAFLAGDGIERARGALQEGRLAEVPDADGLRRGPAISRPSAVVCIGMNYVAHAAESGSAPPTQPVVFLKTPNTVGGPDDAVAIPPRSVKTDWEVELGVVVGSRASYLDEPANAHDHIAGYVLANDLSERQFQLEESGGQWSKGKCAPGFTPTGPWLVSADEVDPANLSLRSWVNDEARQESTTGDMVFNVPFLIWHLSQYMTLEPGDLVLTGTPEGVALSGRFRYLRSGDTVTLEITGLGRQRQRFVEA